MLRGPEFDIAAVSATTHTPAVAAHGAPGEDCSVRQPMDGILLDPVA